MPEVLSSHTKVLFSAVETCPKCPAVRTSEGESAVAGKRGGGRGGEGREGREGRGGGGEEGEGMRGEGRGGEGRGERLTVRVGISYRVSNRIRSSS